MLGMFYLNIIYFWKSIGKLAMGMIIPVIFGGIMNGFLKNDSIVAYLLEILIYVLVYAVSMWKIGMNNYEKNLFQSVLGRFIKKKDKQ